MGMDGMVKQLLERNGKDIEGKLKMHGVSDQEIGMDGMIKLRRYRERGR